MTFSCIFSPLRTFRNATGENSKSPKAGHCSDQSQNARRRITTDPSPSARAVAQATQITPRSPQITNKLLQITPESPQITPRSPQITSKAAPDHARDAEDHGQATPDHARVAADHSHTRAQATQATDDGRRRCAVGANLPPKFLYKKSRFQLPSSAMLRLEKASSAISWSSSTSMDLFHVTCFTTMVACDGSPASMTNENSAHWSVPVEN
jgi:hypothetical protein